MVTLRQPGTQFDWFLPEEREKEPDERTTFVLKVLTWDEWKQFSRHLDRLTARSGAQEALEITRKCLGIGLIDVKNLKIFNPDGPDGDFVLEKKGTEISADSMAFLMPYKEALMQAIQEAATIGVNDVKNSPLPSPT